jgi:hypothetical protein
MAPPFPRTGTTWLYAILRNHPDIYLPYRKELHYFDRNADKGLEWYRRYFADRGAQPAAGDITPDYAQFPHIAGQIRALAPDARVVLIVRDPIERLYSEYLLYHRTGQLEETFERLIEDPEFRGKSLYASKLGAYLDVFPPGRVFTMVYEDSLTNPRRYLRGLLEFLEVDATWVDGLSDAVLGSKVNRTVLVRSLGLHRLLHAVHRFGRHQHIGWLDRLLNRGRDTYYRIFPAAGGEAKVTPELRSGMVDLFRQDVERVSDLVGRDLSLVWRFPKARQA